MNKWQPLPRQNARPSYVIPQPLKPADWPELGEDLATLHADTDLLKSWNKISPAPGGDGNDVAFKAGASAEYVPKNPGQPKENVRDVTLGTWNMREMLLENTPQKLREKAEVIQDIGADILAVQEVGSLKQLDDFQTHYLGSNAYPYRVLIGGNDRHINVALLSKFPIQKAYTYRDHQIPVRNGESMPFARDLLEAVVQVTPQMPMRVFVTHSKRPTSSWGEARNAAELKEIRKIVSAHISANPDECIALMGDLNITPDRSPIRGLDGDNGPLQDPLKFEGKEFRPTEHRRRLDYILVSQPLMKRYFHGSANIIKLAKRHSKISISDHDPVVMRFRTAGSFPQQARR